MFTSRIHQNSYLPGEGIYRLVAIADIWRQQVAWTHFVSINESLKQSLNITSLKLGRKRIYLFPASDKQSNLLPLPRNSLSMKTEKRKISIRTGKTTCVKSGQSKQYDKFWWGKPILGRTNRYSGTFNKLFDEKYVWSQGKNRGRMIENETKLNSKLSLKPIYNFNSIALTYSEVKLNFMTV